MINLNEITDYINEVEKLSELDISKLNLLIQKIDYLIKEDKENGKLYGSFRGQLLKIKKKIDYKKRINTNKQNRYNELDKISNWVPLQSGYLKIGHKPGGKKRSFDQLFKEGVTTVFTILSEREGALNIQEKCKNIGVDWIWLSLPNGDIPKNTMIPEILLKLKMIKTKLDNQEKIYLHCSAGLHRTGMITNCILRFLGYDEAKSYEIINQLRPITAKEVGKKRLDFGKQFYNVTI